MEYRLVAAWILGAALMPAASGLAQSIDQLNTGAQGAQDVPQIGKPAAGDGLQIDLGNQNGTKSRVDQATGRDLCDPSVPEARRKAAGVSCPDHLKTNGTQKRSGLADDPLLRPKAEDLNKDFKSLDLGDEVPSTVILQQ